MSETTGGLSKVSKTETWLLTEMFLSFLLFFFLFLFLKKKQKAKLDLTRLKGDVFQLCIVPKCMLLNDQYSDSLFFCLSECDYLVAHVNAGCDTGERRVRALSVHTDLP